MLRILFLFVALPLHATVFQLQPVEQQIKESDGIVIGLFLKSRPVELEDGSIATQMIFKMSREYGLQSELFGMNEIIIHYPGGSTSGQHVHLEGVPKFVPGENVVLMVSSREDRYWGMNLGFGTFKLIKYGDEKILVNSIFPNEIKVSQIKLSDFEKKVKAIKGTSFKTVKAPFYPSESGGSRAPASIEENSRSIASESKPVDNKQTEPRFSSLWLVALLAFLGGIFRLLKPGDAE